MSSFIPLGVFFFSSQAHHECPLRDPHQLHADAVDDFCGELCEFLMWHVLLSPDSAVQSNPLKCHEMVTSQSAA